MAVASVGPQMLARVRREAYEAGHVVGRTGKKIATFPTGMTPDGAATLTRTVRTEGATRILETGLALGLSTLAMIEASCELSPEAWRHVSVDPFQRRDWGESGLMLLERAGIVSERGEPGSQVGLRAGSQTGFAWIEEDSTLALPRLVREGAGGFDLAFIDGGHTFDIVFADVLFAMRLVRGGGLIVVDDLWMPAIRTALDFFEKNMGLRREALACEGKRRFAFLRVPERAVARAWDHFAVFGDPGA